MAIYTPLTVARFWSNVDVGRESECWPWRKGVAATGGYGRFKIPHTRLDVRAHRVAWELFNSESLGSRFACHMCDNPICCNPHHIYAGDVESNSLEASQRGLYRPKPQIGAENGNAKLTDEDVARIRHRIKSGETNKAIAEDYPVGHSMISKIRTGKFWQSQVGRQPD